MLGGLANVTFLIDAPAKMGTTIQKRLDARNVIVMVRERLVTVTTMGHAYAKTDTFQKRKTAKVVIALVLEGVVTVTTITNACVSPSTITKMMEDANCVNVTVLE